MSASIPSNLKYTKDHEWLNIEGEYATVGITHFAQEALGDIVFMELPEKDDEIAAGDSFGVVESIKSVSDLYAPISGLIVDTNGELEQSPELINQDPYGSWMIKIKIKNPEEIGQLLDSSKYAELCDQAHG